jgi:ADP-heptose:LPS heptosyltransferase
VLRAARDRVLALADRALLLALPRVPRRGVAIILPHGLGDMVLCTPMLRHLMAHYGNQPILLICSRRVRAYAETYLRSDRIIVFDRDRMRRNAWYRMRIIGTVARAGANVIIQPAYNRVHWVEDALVGASRAAERIGSSGAPMFITAGERARGDRWYTRLIAEPSGPMHDTERSAAFAAALAGGTVHRSIPCLVRPPRHAAAPAGDYVVAACEASSALKTWPAERFLDASLAMAARTGATVVLVGESRPSQPRVHCAVVDLRGRTDLLGLIAILAHARMVLSNDSAPAHLAAALGVPVVAVGGGGMPGRYLPYPAGEPPADRPRLVMVDPPWPCFGCGWNCRYGPAPGTPAPCVTAVSVDAVVGAGREMLGSSGH